MITDQDRINAEEKRLCKDGLAFEGEPVRLSNVKTLLDDYRAMILRILVETRQEKLDYVHRVELRHIADTLGKFTVVPATPEGYTLIGRKELIQACEAYLAKRNAHIEQRREKMIQCAMKKGWLRPKTRQKAIARLENGDAFSNWNTVELRGKLQAKEVKNLLTLAQVADEVVMLNERAAYLLQKHFVAADEPKID